MATTKSTRAPVKSINKSTTEIAANAAAEKARKLASKVALKKEAEAAKPARARKTAKPAVAPAIRDHKAEDAANALKAMRVDYDSYEGQLKNDDDTPQTFEQYLAEQGLQADGTPRAASAVAKPGSYQGPMLALRAAAKSYVTGKNGNPHCNDMIAELLAQLTREQTVATLGDLLFKAGITTATNPYIHLNPGQQSMNLRNKLRGALKAGTMNFTAVEQAVTAALAAK